MLYAMFAQLSDRLHGRFGIRKEVAARWLKCRPKRPAPQLSMDPFLRNPEPLSELRHRQATRDGRPASPLSHCLHSMPNADTPDRAGQDLGASPRRTMPLGRQHSRDLVVVETRGSQFAARCSISA
jgi:hypothetical protein